jgi:hypothetical protein
MTLAASHQKAHPGGRSWQAGHGHVHSATQSITKALSGIDQRLQTLNANTPSQVAGGGGLDISKSTMLQQAITHAPKQELQKTLPAMKQ